MAVGIGLAVNNTKAVLEAMFGKHERVRPHAEVRHRAQRATSGQDKKYHQTMPIQPLIEVALGLYFTGTVFYALANGIYGTLPFLVLFQVGFLYTGLTSHPPAVRRRDDAREGAADRRSRHRMKAASRMSHDSDAKPKPDSKTSSPARRRICFIDGDRGRAVVLRVRHPRPRRRHGDVRGDLLPAVASAGCPNRAELGDLQSQLAAARALPEPILRADEDRCRRSTAWTRCAR